MKSELKLLLIKDCKVVDTIPLTIHGSTHEDRLELIKEQSISNDWEYYALISPNIVEGFAFGQYNSNRKDHNKIVLGIHPESFKILSNKTYPAYIVPIKDNKVLARLSISYRLEHNYILDLIKVNGITDFDYYAIDEEICEYALRDTLPGMLNEYYPSFISPERPLDLTTLEEVEKYEEEASERKNILLSISKETYEIVEKAELTFRMGELINKKIL